MTRREEGEVLEKVWIEVDAAGLEEVILEFREYTEHAWNCLETLSELLNRIDSIWQGKASRAFQARIWRQKSDMESCLKEIRRFAACMEYAKDEYLRCEQDNKENLEEI